VDPALGGLGARADGNAEGPLTDRPAIERDRGESHSALVPKAE
jgi:hypothetical protein